jgi:hypothetical protein
LKKLFAIVSLSSLASGVLGACAAADLGDPEEQGAVRAGVPWPRNESAYSSPTPVVDHGGAVLATSTTYAIFWGPPANFPADLVPGMTALFTGFARSNYLAIANEYMRGATARTRFGGAVSDPTPPPNTGIKWNDPKVGAEICKFFPQPDPNAIYFIFTSNFPSNVNFCAWHASASCNGVTFQVAYLPNSDGVAICNYDTGGVGNLGCNTYSEGTRSIADSVAHEFMEAITDPQIDAWYDKDKSEIGDKCGFNYARCVDLSTGPWQLQTEWSNAANSCVQGN